MGRRVVRRLVAVSAAPRSDDRDGGDRRDTCRLHECRRRRGAEECWECTLKACTWEDDGRGMGPDIIVDDGGDMTLLIHKGVEAEIEFEKNGTLPDPASTDNEEFKIVLGLLKRELPKNPNRWHKYAERLVGVSQETTTGVIMTKDMAKMKNNAIVGNIGHFDNEIDMAGLQKATKRQNI